MATKRARRKAPGKISRGLSVSLTAGKDRRDPKTGREYTHLILSAKVAQSVYGASVTDGPKARKAAFQKAREITAALGTAGRDLIGHGGLKDYRRARFWYTASGPSYTFDESEDRVYSGRHHVGTFVSARLALATGDMRGRLEGYGEGLTLAGISPDAPPKPESPYGRARFLTPPTTITLHMLVEKGTAPKPRRKQKARPTKRKKVRPTKRKKVRPTKRKRK